MDTGLLPEYFRRLCDQADAWSRLCSREELTGEFYRDLAWAVGVGETFFPQLQWALYHIPRDLEAMCDLGQTWAQAAQGLLRQQREPSDGGAFQQYSTQEDNMFRMQGELHRRQQMLGAARANPLVRQLEQNYRPAAAEPAVVDGEDEEQVAGEHADGPGIGEDIGPPEQEEDYMEHPPDVQPAAEDEIDPEIQHTLFAIMEEAAANAAQLQEHPLHHGVGAY